MIDDVGIFIKGIDLLNSNYYDIFDIWDSYAKIIKKVPPGDILSFVEFKKYVSLLNTEIFKYKDTYLIGQDIRGIFVASHLSSKSVKNTVKALKILLVDDRFCILPVNKKVSVMLKRLGYKLINKTGILYRCSGPVRKYYLIN